jgi:hypothetical protein
MTQTERIERHIKSLPKHRETKPGPQVVRSRVWRLWAKSLGEKSNTTNKEADQIALLRTMVVLVNFITCIAIVANIIHNW